MKKLKNIYDLNTFVYERNNNDKYASEEKTNEIFDALINGIKNLFNKAKNWQNKVKGAKEIDKIYLESLKRIEIEIKKQTDIQLNLASAEVETPDNIKKESLNINLNEAEQVGDIPKEDVKNVDTSNQNLDPKTLQNKLKLIEKIIDLIKKQSLKQMDDVLKKYGGAEKNPQLYNYINIKKDEFELAFLNAQMDYFNKAGDKNAINKVKLERDKLQKDLENRYNLDKAEQVKIIINNKEYTLFKPYRYNKNGEIKTIEIIKTTDKPNKVIAKYTYGDTKDKEQEFDINNIETDIKTLNLKPGDKYNYFSNNANKELEVTITKLDNDNELATVKVGEDGNEFKVYYGQLLNKL
jgi:hypothetical protein